MTARPPIRPLYTYAWDICARGTRAFVDELLALGLNGVTLALAYHVGKFISPHNARQDVVITVDGVTYFGPGAGYGDISAQAHFDAGLHQVVRELADDGRLDTRAWTVLLHNTLLGERDPQQVARNAWGAPWPRKKLGALTAAAGSAILSSPLKLTWQAPFSCAHFWQLWFSWFRPASAPTSGLRSPGWTFLPLATTRLPQLPDFAFA